MSDDMQWNPKPMPDDVVTLTLELFNELQAEVTELRARLKGLRELVLAHGENTEATAYPFWYIACRAGSVHRGRNVILRGFWFSREAAEAHLARAAHRYPKTAFVYCDSGHDSAHVKNLYRIAREDSEQQ